MRKVTDGIDEIKIMKAPKWGDWDEYLMEYRGRFRMIALTNMFKLVHGNDEKEINNELRYQVMRKKKEIDKEIEAIKAIAK